jgi:hypothetical protein
LEPVSGILQHMVVKRLLTFEGIFVSIFRAEMKREMKFVGYVFTQYAAGL